LQKWAKRNAIDCFQIYDRDIPETPFTVEKFGERVRTIEIPRNSQLTESQHAIFLEKVKKLVAEITQVDSNSVSVLTKKHGIEYPAQWETVKENGSSFWVDINQPFDTGLVLPLRGLRSHLREVCNQRTVLNLFSHSGHLAIPCLAGGASKVVTIDSAAHSLDWTVKQRQLNSISEKVWAHQKMDVMEFIDSCKSKFDLIVMDPPGKWVQRSTGQTIYFQTDGSEVVRKCLELLSPNGRLILATHFTSFSFQIPEIAGFPCEDLSQQLIEEDCGKGGKYQILEWRAV
jgi:23S rRNA G2069 N7-methylase RlmK/C1962 C5-methylase RlmI